MFIWYNNNTNGVLWLIPLDTILITERYIYSRTMTLNCFKMTLCKQGHRRTFGGQFRLNLKGYRLSVTSFQGPLEEYSFLGHHFTLSLFFFPWVKWPLVPWSKQETEVTTWQKGSQITRITRKRDIIDKTTDLLFALDHLCRTNEMSKESRKYKSLS